MKKILLALCLIGLTSCAAAAEGRTEVYKAQSITQTEKESAETTASEGSMDVTEMKQIRMLAKDGTLLSISIPADWTCQRRLEAGEEREEYLGFSPAYLDHSDYRKTVDLRQGRFFGVCGTGLKETETEFNGMPASVGVYDDLGHFSFIRFHEPHQDTQVLANGLDEWEAADRDMLDRVLQTITIEAQPGASVFEDFQTLSVHMDLETEEPLRYSLAAKGEVPVFFEGYAGTLVDGGETVFAVGEADLSVYVEKECEYPDLEVKAVSYNDLGEKDMETIGSVSFDENGHAAFTLSCRDGIMTLLQP